MSASEVTSYTVLSCPLRGVPNTVLFSKNSPSGSVPEMEREELKSSQQEMEMELSSTKKTTRRSEHLTEHTRTTTMKRGEGNVQQRVNRTHNQHEQRLIPIIQCVFAQRQQ